MTLNKHQIESSFRDPSGFMFEREGALYRQINTSGKEDYDFFISSGLYERLVAKNLLVSHQEVDITPEIPESAYKLIKPERIPFISYPYEWSFSQLKTAARKTLLIQKLAIEAGMSLKDSSAYNIQFYRGKAKLIDTLSFEKYQPGRPWAAYRQFCQHFLAPLALMTYQDIRLSGLLKIYVDGIPLDLASKLISKLSYLNPSLFLHLHLHSRSIRKYSIDRSPPPKVEGRMSKTALLGLIDSLDSVVSKMKIKAAGTDWADYYDKTNYTANAFEVKKQIVVDYLDQTHARTVWDLGANTGVFSRLASSTGRHTISFDIDPVAVEKNYRDCVREKNEFLLPLVMDFTNPSPALGWHHHERLSFLERGPADAVLALALIHHLVIGNNVPLRKAAQFFRACGEWLIIEFIPKEDTQVQKMLSTRQDIFSDYSQPGLEKAFETDFEILECTHIPESGRCIYLMHARNV
jgi:hypothetical protein